jgi:hypothetical protein
VKLWEYLVGADSKLDLSDAGRAKDWFYSQPWWGAPITLGLGWTTRAEQNWQKNLAALRSLARRLKKRRGYQAESQGEDIEADQVLFKYLDMLRVAVKPSATGEPLSRKSFRGWGVFPSVANSPGQRATVAHNTSRYWQNDLDFFWQVVFFSLVDDDAPAFCELCGRHLGDKTKRGKPIKQKLCSSCRHREWKRKQPKKKLREKWRKYYHDNRSFKHGT